MADNEQIGGVSIGITGDYSALAADFAQAQQVAQRAGQGIATALDVAMRRADSLTESVIGSTAAVQGCATALDHFAQESGLAGGELAIFRAVLQSSLEAGMGLVETFAEMAGSADSLGAAVASSAQGFHDALAAEQSATEGADEFSASMQRVRNDSEKFEQAWEGAIAEDRKRATEAQKNAAAFEKAWSDAIKENEERAKASFTAFANSVEQGISHPLQFAGAKVKEFMLELGPMGVAALGVAAGIGAIGFAAFQMVKEFGAAAEATGNLADRLNLTFTQTRELEDMAQIAGVSINGLQMASFRLADALEDASGSGKKVATALREMGVEGKTSGELLSGFLVKLSEIPDDTERIAKAHDVMGRASQQMLPLIKNYGELQAAVKALGNSLDEDAAKKLMHVDDELDKLHIAWNRLKEAMAVKLTPVIEFVVKAAEGAVSPTKDNAGLNFGGMNAASIKLAEDAAQRQQATIEAAKAANAAVAGYFGNIATFQRQAADDWQKAHDKTLTGMKEALSVAETELKKISSALASPLDAGERTTKQGQYNELLAKESGLREAIAAATQKDHDFKVKAIREQTSGAMVLSALLADEANQHKLVAQEVAKTILAYQGLTGSTIPSVRVLAEKTAAAKVELENLAKTGIDKAPILKSSFDLATEAGKSLFDQMKDIGAATQKSFDTSAVGRLNVMFRELGITTEESASKVYALALQAGNLAAQLYADGKLGAGSVTAAAEATASAYKKLQEIVTGASNKTTATQKESYREAQQASRRLFDSLESGLAKNIVEWKGWADTLKKIFQTLAENLIQILLKVALASPQKALAGFLQNSGGVGGAVGKLLGGGSAVTGAMPAGFTAASVAPLITATTANTVATTANTATGAANTAATATDTVATVADTAATAVNAGATVANAIATATNTGALVAKTATEVTSTISYLAAEAANTVSTAANTGIMAANTAALAALTAAVSAAAGASIAGGLASAAGSAAGGVGGALGKIGGALAGGPVTAAITAVSSVVSAVSSVIGNFQMAGMNKSLDIIVHHTLQIANDMANLRVDLWSQYNHMYDRLGEVWNTLKEGGRGGSSGGGSLISFTNTTFMGGASQADADRIGQAIVTQLQRSGAIR